MPALDFCVVPFLQLLDVDPEEQVSVSTSSSVGSAAVPQLPLCACNKKKRSIDFSWYCCSHACTRSFLKLTDWLISCPPFGNCRRVPMLTWTPSARANVRLSSPQPDRSVSVCHLQCSILCCLNNFAFLGSWEVQSCGCLFAIFIFYPAGFSGLVAPSLTVAVLGHSSLCCITEGISVSSTSLPLCFHSLSPWVHLVQLQLCFCLFRHIFCLWRVLWILSNSNQMIWW